MKIEEGYKYSTEVISSQPGFSVSRIGSMFSLTSNSGIEFYNSHETLFKALRRYALHEIQLDICSSELPRIVNHAFEIIIEHVEEYKGIGDKDYIWSIMNSMLGEITSLTIKSN